MEEFLEFSTKESLEYLTTERWLIFLASRRKMAAERPSSTRPPRQEAPNWVQELLYSRQSLDVILDTVLHRVFEEADKYPLKEAAIIINEIGHTSEGTKLLLAKLSQETIDRLIKARREK